MLAICTQKILKLVMSIQYSIVFFFEAMNEQVSLMSGFWFANFPRDFDYVTCHLSVNETALGNSQSLPCDLLTLQRIYSDYIKTIQMQMFFK